MSNASVSVRHQRPVEVSPSRRPGASYLVTLTDKGEWQHADGSDFLFAYIPNDWSNEAKAAVKAAFVKALTMSNTIKEAVRKTTGQAVEDGLYLVDPYSMTKAMNSIEGMGETAVNKESQKGSGTAVSINQQFFAAILGGLGGDVAPMLNYLTKEMGNVQAQTQDSGVKDYFGTVIGLVSLMPALDVAVTTFQYVCSSAAVSKWFVDLNCGSAERQSYDYSYTAVEYNYAPASK
jgi:hypothetical protein